MTQRLPFEVLQERYEAIMDDAVWNDGEPAGLDALDRFVFHWQALDAELESDGLPMALEALSDAGAEVIAAFLTATGEATLAERLRQIRGECLQEAGQDAIAESTWDAYKEELMEHPGWSKAIDRAAELVRGRE